MLGYLIILLTVLPALELALLIKVGSIIGAANTILLILLTGVAGAWLARMQGFRTLMAIQENLNRGVMPTEEMLDGVLILVGGLLLMTPGFITDTLGLILLIPPARWVVKGLVRRKLRALNASDNVIPPNPPGPGQDRPRDFEDADYY